MGRAGAISKTILGPARCIEGGFEGQRRALATNYHAGDGRIRAYCHAHSDGSCAPSLGRMLVIRGRFSSCAARLKSGYGLVLGHRGQRYCLGKGYAEHCLNTCRGLGERSWDKILLRDNHCV